MQREPGITSPYAPDIAELRAWLEKMVAAMKLVELVVAVVSLISRMRDINLELTKRVAHLTRKRPRSESLERLERQLVLPLMGLTGPVRRDASSTDAGDSSKPKKSRKGRHPGRAMYPAHVERVPVKNNVSSEERICPRCGSEMKTIAHSVCEILQVVPARFFIEQRLDETVACPKDDTIVSAAPPPAIVERGKLGDSVIVEATCDKFIEHQPIERQCTRMSGAGVDVAPQTLGRGVAAHIDMLVPVARLIGELTRGPGLLGTDATGIPVLDRDASAGIRSGAIWCWTNARWVTFFYSPSADSDSVRRCAEENQASPGGIVAQVERYGPSQIPVAALRQAKPGRRGSHVDEQKLLSQPSG